MIHSLYGGLKRAPVQPGPATAKGGPGLGVLVCLAGSPLVVCHRTSPVPLRENPSDFSDFNLK